MKIVGVPLPILVPLLIAVASSVLLVAKVPTRAFPAVALVASAVELLRVLGIVSFKVPVLGPALLFGLAMVVGGVGTWVKCSTKPSVTAATLVIGVGLLRALPFLA